MAYGEPASPLTNWGCEGTQPCEAALVECLMIPVNHTWEQPSHLMYSSVGLSMSENFPVPLSSSEPLMRSPPLLFPQSLGSIWYMIIFSISEFSFNFSPPSSAFSMPKLLYISEKRLIHKIPASREMKECQRLMPGQEKIPSAGMSRCHCHAFQALRAMAPSAGPVCCGVATTQESWRSRRVQDRPHTRGLPRSRQV